MTDRSNLHSQLFFTKFPVFSVVAFLLGVLGFGLYGPSLHAQVDSVSRIRAVHLVAGAPSVDAYLDDITPAAIDAVTFLDASRSISLKPGMHNIKVAATGTPKDAALINQDIRLNHDSAYTFFATGSLTALDLQPVVLTRGLSRVPTPGRTLARVLHAGYGAGPVTVIIRDAIDAETTISNLQFRGSSDYVALSAGDIEVEVRTPEGQTIYKANGITPQGALITIVAVGAPIDENFKLAVLLDSDPLGARPMDTLRRVVDNPDGRLRLVHAATRIGDVNATIGSGDGPSASLSFRDASRVEKLQGASYGISIMDAGGSTTIYQEDVEVIPALYRSAVLVGSPDDESVDLVVLTADAGATPPNGKTSLRVLNAADDLGVVSVEIEYQSKAVRNVPSLGFKNFSAYETGDPGNATIRVTRSGESQPVFTATGNLPANSIGTLILTGQLASGNLGMNLLLDSDDAEQAPMILLNGTTGVEEVREIVSHLDIVPNPVQTDVTLHFGITRPERLAIEVYGIDGTLLNSRDRTLFEAGDHTVNLDMSGYRAGTYVLVIRGNDGAPFGIRQVVKIR